MTSSDGLMKNSLKKKKMSSEGRGERRTKEYYMHVRKFV